MKPSKLLRSPYLYLIFIGYYGVWLLWNHIKIPFTNPVGAISYLPDMGYNPENNIVRFLAAILFPPLLCLVYWLVINYNSALLKLWSHRPTKVTLQVVLVLASLGLCFGLGVFQASTNPANNPKDAYGGPYSHAIVDTFHEGETLGPASLYEQKGMKPYRDFVIVHGVFQDPVHTVLAFKLFGRSIGAARTFGSILIICTFVLYYLLLLVLFKRDLLKSLTGLAALGLLLAPAATIPFIGQWLIGIQFPFRDFATILFLIFAILASRYAIGDNSKRLLLTSGIVGFIASAGFANSFDRALYILALSIIWLIMLFTMLPWRRFWRFTLVPYIIGGLLGIPVLGVALKWDYVDFLKYMLSVSKYKEYLDGIIFTRPSVGISVILLITAGLITLAGSWYIQKLRPSILRRDGQSYIKALKDRLGSEARQYYIYILLIPAGIFFLRSAVGRADLSHFAYSVQWLYLLVVYFVIEHSFRRWNKAKHLITLVVLALFGFTCLYYAAVVKDTDISQNTFPVHVSDKELVRPDYLQTAAYISSHLDTNQTFVTLTSEGIWYYLINKPSPIKYPIIWYAFTKDQRTEIADSIANQPSIKYIITNNNWTSNFDYVPNPVRFPEIYSVLNRDYKPVKGIGQQTVWQRIR